MKFKKILAKDHAMLKTSEKLSTVESGYNFDTWIRDRLGTSVAVGIKSIAEVELSRFSYYY